jgi:hypothetical protein
MLHCHCCQNDKEVVGNAKKVNDVNNVDFKGIAVVQKSHHQVYIKKSNVRVQSRTEA